jgi:hypothetical protein
MLEDLVPSPISTRTHGGDFYPRLFNPDRILGMVKDLVDVSEMHELNPFTGQNLQGPKRHFLHVNTRSELSNLDTVNDLAEELKELSRLIGHQIVNPIVTVLIYAPYEKLMPHTDRTRKNPIFTLTGSGHCDTFNNDSKILEDITSNIYPEHRASETLVSPGDALLLFGKIVHGFRNSAQPRIAVSLIESFES